MRLPSLPSAFRSWLSSPVLGYGIAVASVLVSTAVAYMLSPASQITPYLFFYAAVLASLWIGGFWPGITATVLSSVAAHFVLLAPHTGNWRDPQNLVRTAFFCVTFVGFCYLAERRRVRVAAELRRGEERLAAIIESAMDAIITVDDQQRVVVFNEAAEHAFGCTAAEAIGQPLDRFIPQRFREAHRQHVRRFGETGSTTRSLHAPGVLSGMRADGTEFPIEATISKVEAGGQKLFTVILRDITARRQTEQALIRSEKLATVGRLAATVAHEINNPLSAVTNALYLLKSDPTLSATAQQFAAIADAEASRAAQIAKQTLGLSRQASLPASFRPAELVESVLGLLARKLQEKGVALTNQCDAAVEVIGVSGEIRQVIWNLLGNALDAVPRDGRITVRIAQARDWRDRQATGARITIADNGAGIDREALAHIFEPFFTTKATGNGLGLWVTREIIAKHGGSIRVRSNVDANRRGTTFALFVPALPMHANHDAVRGGEYMERAAG